MNRPMSFEHLVTLFQKTHEEVQNRALRAINLSLVIRNWLFGQYIVEFEQHGADRAAYGANLVDALSTRLKQLGIKGVSATRLRLYRTFYREYQQIAQTSPDSLVKSSPANPIQPTLSGELIVAESMQALSLRFTLGWSHYIELLTLDDTAERRFYEIEAAANQWSVRELQRQIASSLYQRLALSRDKDEIRRLAFDGQIVEKAADLIKNPFVLEFLGLEDRPHYSEEELESAIIDQLEIFLLELGKGFLFEARQKRFTFDNDHFRVDLVFYNRLLRCYVLKVPLDMETIQDKGWACDLVPKSYIVARYFAKEQTVFNQLACNKHPRLSVDEIKTLVVDDKWLAMLAIAEKGELDRVSQTLTSRIRQLAERYDTPLPKLVDEVTDLSARGDEHLKRMGFQA